MNKEIARKVRDAACTDCALAESTNRVCVTGSGPSDAKIMVVGKMPDSSDHRASLEADLQDVGIDPTTVFFTSALRCKDYERNVGKTMLKACEKYTQAEIDEVKPKWILTLGNEPLQQLTGHSGIMKHRGRVVDRGAYSVFPTISPSAVGRNPGQRPSYVADLKLFAAELAGIPASIKPPSVKVINSNKALSWLRAMLRRSELLSYDVETYSTPAGNEWAPDAKIVSLSGTSVADDQVYVWALPLYHPQSVWRKNWQQVLGRISKELSSVKRLVAQNGKYDCRWLREFGVDMGVTFDTMLAVHLLDENLPKSLKVQALMRLGVKPWAIDTANLLTTQINEVLKYNALDTFYTYYIYLQARQELIEETRLLRIFQKIMIPANDILIDVERRGVWVDRERLATNRKIAYDMRAELDRQILEWVPDQDQWPKDSKGRPREVNFNPSIFLRWLLFDHLEMPVINRGKEKEDGSPGDPSVAEDVMLELRLNHPHPVVDLLLERSKWQKFCSSFLDSYGVLLDDNDRIHTTFKLYGTVTGRLSSGKNEADKITARAPVRGVNLQQVPRDPFIRSLFGAQPGYAFVEADFSQVELRVAAFLSRDSTMRHLYQTGQDIHRATAAWVLGKPADQVTKDDRKKAKAINFGFVYGMGAKKFVYTAFTKYDVVFSLDEAKDIRRQYFELYTGLEPWHRRQRRLVHQYRRVQSPIGRVRHLPDVDSDDWKVRGEAERQAINSPVQSFASDMTMLSMIEISRQFRERGIEGYFISTVHDALLFEVAYDDVGLAMQVIKHTMENLPLKKKFGIEIDLPIVADLKLGRNWGEALELTEDQVWNYTPDLLTLAGVK